MIFHVLDRSDWADALAQGSYEPASLAAEGFVHASTPTQVEPVIGRFYAHVAELWILTIDEGLLGSELRWEAPAHPDGSPAADTAERFPHVYGAIAIAAVLDARPWHRDNPPWDDFASQ